MPSVPETFFALWGAEIAAVANPVNYFLEASQIAAIMKQAGARALIAAGPSIFPDIWPKVEAIRLAMPELKVFRVGGGPAACRRHRLRTGLRGPAGRPARGAEGDRSRHRGGAVPYRRDDRTAEARQAHPRRAHPDGLDQCAGLRFRAGHGAAQSLAAVPCRRLAVRRAVADRQRLDDPGPDAARRAQSQRRARLLGHRRAQQGRRRRRRADHAGGHHERAARRPRPVVAESLRDRWLDGARRAHPPDRARDRCAGGRGLRHDRSALLLDHESAARRAPPRVGRTAPALHRDPHRRRGARRHHPPRLRRRARSAMC